MMLTPSGLILLRAVRDSGSLARAATALGVTPPAVSQQLTKLERDVGSLLVERGARGTRLTQLGASLAAYGDRVAADLEDAERSVAEFVHKHAQRLRIGAFPSAAVALLPEALATLRYRHPRARLSVIDVPTDGGIELVASGQLDFGISASYGQALPTAEGVRLEFLFADPLWVVAPKGGILDPHPPSRPIPLAALRDEPWVCGIADRPSRLQLEAAGAQLGFEPWVPFQTESYDVAQALAASGVAVAFVPTLALLGLYETSVRRLDPPLGRDLYAVLPSNTDHIPLATELLAAIRDIQRVEATQKP